MSAVSQFWQGIEIYSLGYTYSLIIHVVNHTCTCTIKLNCSKNNHVHIKRTNCYYQKIFFLSNTKLFFYEAIYGENLSLTFYKNFHFPDMHIHCIFDYIRKHFILGVACKNSYVKLIMDIMKASSITFQSFV